MRRFFIDKEFIFENSALMGEVERNHLVNVLRLKEGDNVVLTCGDGFEYVAKVGLIQKKSVELEILEKKTCEKEPKVQVDFYQALSRPEKMELLVQKLTELGITSFIPFASQFVSVKGQKINLNRLDKITKESIKQCERSNPLKIVEPISFDTMIERIKDYDLCVFAYEKEENLKVNDLFEKINVTPQKVMIIIGCEGGFSKEESDIIVEANAQRISLGKRILRLETAGISLATLVMHYLGEI